MDDVKNLVEQLGSADLIKSFQARRALELAIATAGAPGHDTDRAELSSRLVSELLAKSDSGDSQGQPRRMAEVRHQLARLVSTIAGPTEVPALAPALADFDVRESARFALDRMTDAAATKALADAAATSVGQEFRVGVMSALGRRDSPESTAALRAGAEDTDTEVRLAAAEALAHSGVAETDLIIAAAAKGPGSARSRAQKRVARARIRLAENVARNGNKDAARKIFQAVAADAADDAQKQAAERGLAQLG